MKITLVTRRVAMAAAAALCLAFPALAAQLDLAPDAVLGKPDFTTAAGVPASATSLLSPAGTAQDPVTGELWVADDNAHRVLRFASAAAFANGEAANLVLGQASFTATGANRGGAVAANTLRNPVAVAVDQAGRLYVADTQNHRVVVYHPPHASGMDASAVIGQAGFTTAAANRGGAVSASGLSAPLGVAVDDTGNLFVADSGNHRVLRFDAPAGTGAAAAKVFGQGGSFATATPATTAIGLNGPTHAFPDASGHLWIADRDNNRVLRFDGGAGAGDATADLVLCQATFTSAGAGASSTACNAPAGVAVTVDGRAWVADQGNNRVMRFDTLANGAAHAALVGQAGPTGASCNQGLGAPSAATLCSPVHVLLDRDANLLVADYFNDRVLRFDRPRAQGVPTISSLSPASVPQVNAAFTLTVNGAGFHGGSVVNLAGTPLATHYLSGSRLLAQVPANAILSLVPVAVTVTNAPPGGGTSVAANLAPYARAVLDATADRVLGQPGFAVATAFNPQVGEARVGATNAAVLEQFNIQHAAIDRGSGRLFVAAFASGRVLSWPSVTAFHNGQAADVVLGKPDGFTAGCTVPPGPATLCQPYGVAVDPAGALYVSDTEHNRVLRFSPPFTTGMAASRVFGQGGDFATAVANKGGRSAASLSEPTAVAAHGGKLFVVDNGNRRILVYDAPDASLAADAVIGQADMVSLIAQSASATGIGAGDSGLAVDDSGRLHFADNSNHRVLRFTPPFANGHAADLVLGQPDLTTSSLAATSATSLAFPLGIAFDPAGNLLVADGGNSRVLRYAAPLATGMAASGVIGQPDFGAGTFGTSATKLRLPKGLATDRVGNLVVVDAGNARLLGFDRPFAFALDPAGDLDGDGIPNAVEPGESRDPYAKDNDIFAGPPPGPRLFAMQQYRDFLGREGDPDGVIGWTGLVTTGTYSRLQVIDAFLGSAEFAGSVAPVVRLYFATFLRVPDHAGLSFNAGLVRTGAVTLPQLADFFTASPEFAATYGALDDTQFVTLLYNNVLARAPDPGGLAGWVTLLGSGYSRGQVLLGFSESAEYQAQMAHEVFVTMMYAGMLRRTPEPAGFNGWLSALDAGTYTREQVINGFYLSEEYRRRFLP
jgi:sugar lactone lactonase YvrE